MLQWDSNKLQNYIPIEKVLNDFNSPYHGIVQTFFHYFQIYYDDYFLFVCIFSFCNLSQILYILLASCQLYPAKYITKDEINQFFKSTKISHSNSEMFSRIVKLSLNNNKNKLSPILSPNTSPTSPKHQNDSNSSTTIVITTTTTATTASSPREQYYLKSFIDFVLSCDSYKKLVNDIKKTLINVVITPRIYSSIIKRLNFYNNYSNSNNSRVSIPTERCTSKAIRILFSNRPEPYHYDFRLQSLNPDAINDVVKKIVLDYKASGTLSPVLEINKRKKKEKHAREKEDMNKTNNTLMFSDRMHHRTKLSPQNLRKADSEKNVKSPEKPLTSFSPLQSTYPRIFVNRISPVETVEDSDKHK